MIYPISLFLTPPLIAYWLRRKSKLIALAITFTWLVSVCPTLITVAATLIQTDRSLTIQTTSLLHKDNVRLPYATSNYRQVGSLHGLGTSWLGRDYAMPCGTVLFAPITGIVSGKGTDNYCGRNGCRNTHITFTDGNGLEVMLMHGDYSIPIGARVIAGKTYIGTEASNGNSDMCHTHYTMRINGKPIDPDKEVTGN